jgi:UDP-N-acetylglucosamine 2-epimerase
MTKLLVVFGTRPEAIKLCPLILELRRRFPAIETKVCVTAQHRELLDQVLRIFRLTPDHDLNCMRPGQTLAQTGARILTALEPVLAAEHPSLVVVQGDTSTTFYGALAAFYARVPVAHVEAGLRTANLDHPFPEEANRVLTARLTRLHFPPTPIALENLRREGVAPDSMFVTGNTAIDAVLYVRDGLLRGNWPEARIPVPPGRRLLLVTAHRRESFGGRFERICHALAELAKRPDVQIVYPVHPNPNVRDPVHRLLGGLANVELIEPLEYVPFVWLLMQAAIVLTDSGGIQEEAPALGKPVLVMRDTTERPEGIAAGSALLVGADAQRIVGECARLLDTPAAYRGMAEVRNPYGDGRASERIAEAIAQFLGTNAGTLSHSALSRFGEEEQHGR